MPKTVPGHQIMILDQGVETPRSTGMGRDLEPGIRGLVHSLCARGFKTIHSCEGHPARGPDPRPLAWITFEPLDVLELGASLLSLGILPGEFDVVVYHRWFTESRWEWIRLELEITELRRWNEAQRG